MTYIHPLVHFKSALDDDGGDTQYTEKYNYFPKYEGHLAITFVLC